MQPFVYDDEVDRIDLDGEWVDLKRRMSYGDIDKLSANELKDLQKGGTSIPLLVLNIKAWSFLDREGNPAPVNRKNIEMLNLPLVTRLLEEITKRNPFG
jgi:hypothetical protein